MTYLNPKVMKEPSFLCRWDFCSSCIDFRIRNKYPLNNLKGSKGYDPYFRINHPNWKPSQPRKIKK